MEDLNAHKVTRLSAHLVSVIKSVCVVYKTPVNKLIKNIRYKLDFIGQTKMT